MSVATIAAATSLPDVSASWCVSTAVSMSSATFAWYEGARAAGLFSIAIRSSSELPSAPRWAAFNTKRICFAIVASTAATSIATSRPASRSCAGSGAAPAAGRPRRI